MAKEKGESKAYAESKAYIEELKNPEQHKYSKYESDGHCELIDTFLTPPKWEVGDVVMNEDNLRFIVCYKNKHNLTYMRLITTAGFKQYAPVEPTWRHKLKYDPEYISAKLSGKAYDPFIGKRAKPRVKALIQDCKKYKIVLPDSVNPDKTGPGCEKRAKAIFDATKTYLDTLIGKELFIPNKLADLLSSRSWESTAKEYSESVYESDGFEKLTITTVTQDRKTSNYYGGDGRELTVVFTISGTEGTTNRPGSYKTKLISEQIQRAWDNQTSSHTGKINAAYINTTKYYSEVFAKYLFTSL